MAEFSKCSCPQPNKWLKGKVIGSGSFGSVHLSMDKATGGLFVLKSADSEAGLKCLENEVEILENLDSPHIVKFIGKDLSFEVNGKRKLSLFLEYMVGGSLADVAEKFGGSLDEEVICLYTKGILQGLKYLHENGIVHCDLKCKNILLGTSGEIKLADFGCAKRIKDNNKVKDSNNRTKSLLKSISGTPLWMAPEMLRNEELDFAADIWSLGCTVIEMATGKTPWGGGDICKNPLAAVLKIASSNEMPEFPSHFSGVGLDFLGKCLERDNKKRWKVEQLLDHPFVSKKGSEKIDVAASTPASVLEHGGIFSDMDYSSSSDEDESVNGNAFSTRCDREFWISTRGWKMDLDSSENWINVRN